MLAHFGVDPNKGRDPSTARSSELLAMHGVNRIPPPRITTLCELVWAALQDRMLQLLLVTGMDLLSCCCS